MAETLNQFGDVIDDVELSPFGDPLDALKPEQPPLPDEDNPFQFLDQNLDLMGEAIDLPVPNTQMYSDIKGDTFSYTDKERVRKKAEDRYEMYVNHPDATKDAFGNILYKGDIVPKPDVGLFSGDATVPLTSKMGYGLKRAGKNILELGAAGLEALRASVQENIGAIQVFDTEGKFSPDLLNPTELDQYYAQNPEAGVFGGRRLDAVEGVQDNIADVNTGDSLTDDIVIEATGLFTGGGAGVKAVSWLPKLTKSKFVNNIGRMLGFEVGATAGLSSDVDTLVVGGKSMLNELTGGKFHEAMPFLKGIDAPPESEEYQKVLGARFNIMADAMAIMGPAEAAVRGLTGAGVLAWSMTGGPLFAALKKNTAQEMIVRDILDEFAGVTGDPVADKEARERILKLVEDNKDVFIDIPPEMGGTIEYTTDTMSAILRALENDDTAAARKLYTTAQGLLKKQVQQGRGSPELIEKVSTPGRTLEDTLSQSEEVFGGTDAINRSGDEFVATGQKVIDEAEGVVTDLTGQLDALNNQVGTLLREDPTFGQKIQQIEDIVQFDIYAGRNQASDEIVTNLRQAFEEMTEQKNNMYRAIQGGDVNVDGLINILQDLNPSQISAAREQLKPGTMFARLLDEFQPKGKKEIKDPAKFKARIEKFVADEGLDFEKLYTEIRPTVSQNASDMFDQNNNAAGRVLRQFVEYIDTKALDDLIESGDQEVADAAMAAKEYYMKSYAPFWKDGMALEEVGKIHTRTVGRTSEEMAKEGLEIQPKNFKKLSRQQIEGALSDTNREAGENIVGLLGQGGNANLVTDYIIGDVMGKLSTRVTGSTKIPDIDTSDVINSLQEYGTLIRQNFPEQATRIDGLLEKLRSSSLTREQLQTEIKLAQDASQAAKDKIYSDELAAFFQPGGKGKINGYEAFREILRNPQSARKMPGTEEFEGPLVDLINTAKESGNPVLMDGMRAAYSRFLKDKLLAATEELGGNRMLRTGVNAKIRDELDNTILYGKAIFQDQPALINGLEELLKETGIVTRAKAAKAIGAGSDTYANQQAQMARQALDKSVTLTLGVLSRAGARIRAGGAGVIAKAFNPKAVAAVTDVMFAYPDEFLRVAKKVTIKDNKVSTAGMEALKTFALRAGIYNEDNEPSDAELLELIMDTERMFREGRDAVQQTGEALMEGVTQ